MYTQISRQENESMVTFLTLTRHFFLHTTPIDVINSWGISKMYATQIVKNVNGEDFTMAVLVMHVNCFQFQGKVYIDFDELGDVLDSMIETGGMTKEEYQAKGRTLFVASNISILVQG